MSCGWRQRTPTIINSLNYSGYTLYAKALDTKNCKPNTAHRERIGQLMGQMEQGELFHTNSGVPQSEATTRYGTPPSQA